MANALIPKKSSVVGKVPLATDLQVGEIAVNLADRKMYSKDSGGTVFQLGGGGVFSFNGRTGDIVQISNDVTDALGYTPVNKSGDTMTGKLTLDGVSTATAPLNMPNVGTTDPTTIANGDIWQRSYALYARLNGSTRMIIHSGTYSTVLQAEAEAGTATTIRWWTAQRVQQAVAAYSYQKTYIDALEARIAALENIITNGTVKYSGKITI